MAANGAEPVGVLVTVLLSEQASEDDLRFLMEDVHRAASELKIEVLGGHTEVTPGLPATIISSTAVGKAPKSRYVTTSGAKIGDSLVLTKSAGLEGTAILATDFENSLRNMLGPEMLARAQSFREEISVVREGVAAAELGATAMHDPTEGGVLGHPRMSTAAQWGWRFRPTPFPVRRRDEKDSRYLPRQSSEADIQWALLIACPDGEAMVEGLARRGVASTIIGRFTVGGGLSPGERRELELSATSCGEFWRPAGASA